MFGLCSECTPRRILGSTSSSNTLRSRNMSMLRMKNICKSKDQSMGSKVSGTSVKILACNRWNHATSQSVWNLCIFHKSQLHQSETCHHRLRWKIPHFYLMFEAKETSCGWLILVQIIEVNVWVQCHLL